MARASPIYTPHKLPLILSMTAAGKVFVSMFAVPIKIAEFFYFKKCLPGENLVAAETAALGAALEAL
jgi:hypothetical protein